MLATYEFLVVCQNTKLKKIIISAAIFNEKKTFSFKSNEITDKKIEPEILLRADSNKNKNLENDDVQENHKV